MRLRTRSAVVVMALLATAGLSSCRTNVGLAATIDGSRVTETQVNDLVGPDSQPLAVQAADGSNSHVGPRSFVVNILIKRRLFDKLLGKTPLGSPSDPQLAKYQRQLLNGQTVTAAADRLGVKGYPKSFDKLLVEVQVMGTLLQQQSQQGVDVNGVAAKLAFPVTVNPRYGRWDPSTLTLSAGPTAGLPGYLNLQPAASASPTAP